MSDLYAWNGIEPGDFGWDQGGGLVGYVIRLFTKSPFAHCWVYVREVEPNLWITHEAYPGGLRERRRHTRQVHKVLRLWRTPDEQSAVLKHSRALVGKRYAYSEIVRIMLARFVKVWSFGQLGFPQPTMREDPRSVICSNHVARCAAEARGLVNLGLAYSPAAIWPGRLARDLDRVAWNDSRRS